MNKAKDILKVRESNQKWKAEKLLEALKDYKKDKKKRWTLFGGISVVENNFVIIKNRIITDRVDLNDLDLDFGVIFENCLFDSHFQAIGSSFHSLLFWGCDMQTVDCYGIHTKHDLCFKNSKHIQFIARGQVRIANARIGKDLSFDGGLFEGGLIGLSPDDDETVTNEKQTAGLDTSPSGDGRASTKQRKQVIDEFKNASVVKDCAIDAGGIQVGGSLIFNDIRLSDRRAPTDFMALGHVNCVSSKIGNRVVARGARFFAGYHSEEGIFIPSSKSWDHVFGGAVEKSILENKSIPDGEKDERKKQHDSIKYLTKDNYKAVFKRYMYTVISLNMYDSEIGSSLHFSYGTVSVGTLRLGGCKIGGKVSFKGAKLYEVNPVNEGAESSARKMARSIVYLGGTSYLPWGALDAVHMKVDGGIYMCSIKRNWEKNDDDCGNFCAFGRVSLDGSQMGGRLYIGGGHFFKSDDSLFSLSYDSEKSEQTNNGEAEDEGPDYRLKPSRRHTSALNLSNTKIGLDFVASDNAIIVGRLWMDNAVIEGKCVIDKTNIFSYRQDRVAIHARGCEIKSVLEIVNRSLIVGCCDFKEAKIKSSVSLENSIFTCARVPGYSFYGVEEAEGVQTEPDRYCEYFTASNEDGKTQAQNAQAELPEQVGEEQKQAGIVVPEDAQIIDEADHRPTKPEPNVIDQGESPSGIHRMPSTPVVRFNTSDPDQHPFQALANEAVKISLQRPEKWETRRDRHWNETQAVNFYRAVIGGDFHVSCKNYSGDACERDDSIVSKSAFIAGKLNMVEAQINGNLRLEVSPMENILGRDAGMRKTRFNLEAMVEPLFRKNKNLSPIFSINLCGTKVNAFSLCKTLLDYAHLSIDGFRYNRLVGKAFNKPDFGKKLMHKTCRNYSLEGNITDISSTKRMLSYYESSGNHKCIEAFDSHLAAMQSLCSVGIVGKLLRSLIQGLLVLSPLITVGCLAYWLQSMFTQCCNVRVMQFIALVIFIVAYSLWLYFWGKSVNGVVMVKPFETGGKKYYDAIMFRRMGFYTRAFVRFGHGYLLAPLLVILSAWMLMSSCFALISPWQEALVQGVEICLPPAGLITTSKEKLFIDKLVAGGQCNEVVLQARSIIVISKVLGWLMLSLMVAGYFKLLKTN